MSHLLILNTKDKPNSRQVFHPVFKRWCYLLRQKKAKGSSLDAGLFCHLLDESFKNCILNLLRLALSNMTKQNRNNEQTNQEGQILFYSTLHLYSVARCLRASLLRTPDITSCPHQRNLQFFTHSRGACSVLFWVTWLRSRENTGAFVVLCPWTWALKLFVFAHFLGA